MGILNHPESDSLWGDSFSPSEKRPLTAEERAEEDKKINLMIASQNEASKEEQRKEEESLKLCPNEIGPGKVIIKNPYTLAGTCVLAYEGFEIYTRYNSFASCEDAHCSEGYKITRVTREGNSVVIEYVPVQVEQRKEDTRNVYTQDCEKVFVVPFTKDSLPLMETILCAEASFSTKKDWRKATTEDIVVAGTDPLLQISVREVSCKPKVNNKKGETRYTIKIVYMFRR